jgi:3-oxoacyl-[acyl-carrier-protein] synthase-1
MSALPLPITAWSAVNGLGRSTKEVLASLDEGRSGLRPPPFDLPIDTVVGAVPGNLPPLDRALAAYDCRIARFSMMAFEDVRGDVARAIARHGARRVGIVLGTSTGGLDATEQAYFAWRRDREVPPDYDFRRQHSFNALGELIARVSGVAGPVYTISTACSSSGKVHASAARLIAAGICDAVLVGGSDSLCRMTLQGFHGLGVLSKAPCGPFAEARTGINIGEGAAFQLVEREADADVWLLGVGESSDAHHMSSPHPEGRGAAEAMSRAMDAASVRPEDVDLLNAHGTATALNDAAEAIAVSTLFGDRLPVTSTKGYTGHLLGAAAATEAVLAIHAVRTGRIPATLGCERIDPNVKIDVVTQPRKQRVRRALSNSFAFGGSNVSLLVGERA